MYVIVSKLNGEAGRFNNNLRSEVFSKFGAKSSKLPAHFTIKAPFEYEKDIIDLEQLLENFARQNSKTAYKIEGYNHFDDRVIYMQVNMSKEGKELHDTLIDKLSSLPYIHFEKTDGKDKIFHVTISSKKITKIFNELWNYVSDKECNFQCEFDNICIFKWQDNDWKLHREYNL